MVLLPGCVCCGPQCGGRSNPASIDVTISKSSPAGAFYYLTANQRDPFWYNTYFGFSYAIRFPLAGTYSLTYDNTLAAFVYRSGVSSWAWATNTNVPYATGQDDVFIKAASSRYGLFVLSFVRSANFMWSSSAAKVSPPQESLLSGAGWAASVQSSSNYRSIGTNWPRNIQDNGAQFEIVENCPGDPITSNAWTYATAGGGGTALTSVEKPWAAGCSLPYSFGINHYSGPIQYLLPPAIYGYPEPEIQTNIPSGMWGYNAANGEVRIFIDCEMTVDSITLNYQDGSTVPAFPPVNGVSCFPS